MDYLELDVKVTPRQPGTDLLITELAEMGFESFAETEEGFLAYIPSEQFSEALLAPVQGFAEDLGRVNVSRKLIPGQNWNAEWEKGFLPVLVSGRCLVRAPFHPPVPGVELELIIQPQQSFGTGHHPTTRLMAEKLLTMRLDGRYVLDMGCGTGLLAILASKLGAAGVVAIDIEENSVENARENVLRNEARGVSVNLGTENAIAGRKFDVVLANINKNVLLNALPAYVDALKPGGELLLSGFFHTDVEAFRQPAMQNGLQLLATETDGEWALLHFTRS